MNASGETVRTISIILSRGSLDGVYPALILANGAQMEGMRAQLFFTFFGVKAVTKRGVDDLKLAAVGNPALRWPTSGGFSLPPWIGMLPGMEGSVTAAMKRELDRLDIPPVSELLEMIHDAGGKLFACKASVEMFRVAPGDLCAQVDGVVTVGEFLRAAEGGQIVFT